MTYSVPHFPQNSGGIACWMTEPKPALCLVERARKSEWKKKKLKYEVLHFLEWESNPQHVALTVACLNRKYKHTYMHYSLLYMARLHVTQKIIIFKILDGTHCRWSYYWYSVRSEAVARRFIRTWVIKQIQIVYDLVVLWEMHPILWWWLIERLAVRFEFKYFFVWD